jgi:hypothetical protein
MGFDHMSLGALWPAQNLLTNQAASRVSLHLWLVYSRYTAQISFGCRKLTYIFILSDTMLLNSNFRRCFVNFNINGVAVFWLVC